jgi:DNA polymerase-3 subunit delta
MIYLLHGKDTFQSRRAFDAIRKRLQTPDGSLESNTIFLDGAKITPLELMQQATTVPFLSPARLVVVEGLLAAIGSMRGGRKKKGEDPLEPWRTVAEQIGDPAMLPETTTLVLLEGDLDKRNAAFTIFAPIAQTTEYLPVKEKEVASWIRAELKNRTVIGSKLNMTDGAIRALAAACGADLWAVSSELEKLDTFAQGEQVDEHIVAELVADAHATKMWDLTDAVVAGNERKSLEMLSRLLVDGEPPPLLSSVIARQYRQLVIVKDLREQRASDGEVARAAGVPEWKVGGVAALAGRCTWPDLRRAYNFLLEADLNVKRGLQDDESALQLLVHELCAMAPRSNQHPAYAR